MRTPARGSAAPSEAPVRSGRDSSGDVGTIDIRQAPGDTRVALVELERRADREGAVWWGYADSQADAAVTDAGSGGLVRLQDGRQTSVVTGGDSWGPVSIGADGTVWFGGPTAFYRIGPDALP